MTVLNASSADPIAAGGERAARASSPASETMARSITDPDRQTQALAAMAMALVARGDTRQAHHVGLSGLRGRTVDQDAGLVLSLEPSAITVLTGL